MGWSVAIITAYFNHKIVIISGAATALVSIALSIYACFSKESIEYMYGIAFIVIFAMIPLGILSSFMQLKVIHVLYCMIGLFLYSIFLLIDTKMILSGKSFGNYDIVYDDYILASLMLYMDIIMIFVYLLKILGGIE